MLAQKLRKRSAVFFRQRKMGARKIFRRRDPQGRQQIEIVERLMLQPQLFDIFQRESQRPRAFSAPTETPRDSAQISQKMHAPGGVQVDNQIEFFRSQAPGHAPLAGRAFFPAFFVVQNQLIDKRIAFNRFAVFLKSQQCEPCVRKAPPQRFQNGRGKNEVSQTVRAGHQNPRRGWQFNGRHRTHAVNPRRLGRPIRVLNLQNSAGAQTGSAVFHRENRRSRRARP